MSTNIGLDLRQRAVLSPEVEAYVEPSTDVRMNYRELNQLINRCASVLEGLELKAGDRVALLMQNSIEFVSLFYAAAKLGIVVVPLNTRLAAAELAFILSDSGTSVLFYGPECAETTKGIKGNQEHALAINAYIQTHPSDDDDNSLNAMLEGQSAEEPEVLHGGDDNLFIMYTSGTTGLPKGVVHTHNSISWSSMSWATTMDVRYQDRMWLPLPMFHVAALTCVITCGIGGATIVSMPNFDPSAAWGIIRDERVNIGGAVPAILNFMRQVPEFESFDSPHLRCFITGGAPMPKSLVEMFNQKNLQVVQGYALTETGGGGTFLLNEYAISKAGSAGTPSMFCELQLRDDAGNIFPYGEGEVVIKAPFLLKEYWNRPDATAEAFDQGWFRTGDIAAVDEAGFVLIKDRIKDMIISGGENVYPAEIENVILAHPAVGEVAVIGLEDEKWGEIACAIVVGDQEQASEEEIIKWCSEKLSRYKLPKKVEYVDILPRNPAGKVLKRVLRDQFS
jgi:O-succinylbenzoate-CoA ligase